MSSISVKMKKSLENNLYIMLAEVATYADIVTTHLTPQATNRVIVTADENFTDKRTMYAYDGTDWEFVGVVDELLPLDSIPEAVLRSVR